MAYQKIRVDVDATHVERNDPHWEAKREHRRLLDELFEEQRAEARREGSRLREQEEKQREAEEEELMKQKPWLQDIALCDLLTAFCQRCVRAYSSQQRSTETASLKDESAGRGDAPKLNVVDTEDLGETVSRKSDSNRYTEKGKQGKTNGHSRKLCKKKAARIVNLLTLLWRVLVRWRLHTLARHIPQRRLIESQVR